MKMKQITSAIVGLLLAESASAAIGTYTYKLIVRDDFGMASYDGVEYKVTDDFEFDVRDANDNKITSVEVCDVNLAEAGCNCTLAIGVGEAAGDAPIGSQLKISVKYYGSPRYSSSKVLPPVAGAFGYSKTAIGLFYADPSDTDSGYDAWSSAVKEYCAIGGRTDDDDNDGLTNLQEYQRGTDPYGGEALELPDTPGFSIVEKDGGYEVKFNYSFSHVYSIRKIEGDTVVGKDGEDLDLFASKGGDFCGKFFYDDGYEVGTKTFFVEKPEGSGYCIGLAIDGQLLEYIKVAAPVEPIVPGVPGEELAVPSGKTVQQFVDDINTNDAVKAQYLKAPEEVKTTSEYPSYFVAVPAGDEKVMFVLNEAGTKAVQTAQQEAKTNLLANVLAATGTGEKAAALTIENPIIGFYYHLTQTEHLTGGTPLAAQKLAGSDEPLSFDLMKWSASGFYRLIVSPTPVVKGEGL